MNQPARQLSRYGWRPADPPRRPVLFINPRSGDGKAVRAGLAERARDKGIETVMLAPGQDLAALARQAVAGGADVLGMAGGDGSLAVVTAVAAAYGIPFVCGTPLPAVEDVRRRLGLGLEPGTPGVIVGQWLEGWLASKQRTRRASTTRGYESHIRVHIVPVIGDLPLERISAAHVERVLAAVPGSAATRHRVLATLRAALNAAVKQRQITFNPCTGVELEPENPPEQRRWTPAQARQFIDATAADPLGLAYRVMVLTGCRRAELTGFRWAGADLEVPYRDPETGEQKTGAVLTVARPILQLGGKLHEEPTAKSRAGDRLVFLDADTAILLRAHRETQQLEQQFAGEAWADNDLVFCQPGGKPWNPATSASDSSGWPRRRRSPSSSSMRAAGIRPTR